MSDPINHLRVLHNNPFIFKAAFVEFFKQLGEKERGFLLGYLVLPMALHPSSHKFLRNATSRSSLRTMLHDRNHLHGLDERVAMYRDMTNTTIQYLSDIGDISIHNQLNFTVVNQHSSGGPSPTGVVKAARRLGTFFHPYDVPTVFRMLGVMSL